MQDAGRTMQDATGAEAPSSSVRVIAVVTGERGHREIVRPLTAVGVPCAVLDWEELRAAGGQTHARFIPALWKIVRANRGAVVFTDMSSAFLAVILFVAKLHGSPVFLRLRGDPFAETRDQLQFHWRRREWPQLLRSIVSWFLDRPLFAAVDRFVPVSDWIVQRLDIQNRACVVRIPIPVESFPPRQHREGRPVRLLSVTNFNYPQKIAALGRFLESYGGFLAAQEMTVTVAGTGIAWSSFRARHEKDAQFPGFIRDVAALYAEHDVFVHFSDLDAFPYVVLEAQAAGLPVIVNPACGMLEQVEHEITGFLANLSDRPAVEALLLRLRDSSSLRAQFGARARETIASRYTLAAIGENLRSCLDGFTGSTPPP
jgi:glycosyltransferase involved in cell wall biosynthesis